MPLPGFAPRDCFKGQALASAVGGTMPLKIIGAGFGRTGTMSTYTALNQLGFPCYHMVEAAQTKANAHHMDFWHMVANAPAGAQHNWETVFANYTATVDNPGCCVWRELMHAYPDAKVLLTLHPRGADAWYESTIDTIYRTETMWEFKVLGLVIPFARKMNDMLHKLIWQRSHKGTMSDRSAAIAHYNAHIEDVKKAAPSDRLLVFTTDQGWAPLCAFLGVPVPDTPFPNVNDRAQFKQQAGKAARAAHVIVAVAILLAIGVIGAFWSLI